MKFETEEANLILREDVAFNSIVPISLIKFQRECSEFLLSYVPVSMVAEENAQLIVIISIMQDIIEFPNFRPKARTPIALEALENILRATERLFTKAPRYDVQSSEMSLRVVENLSKAQFMAFIERMTRENTALESQRAIKKDDDLDKTLEKIWKLSKRMENQSYAWTKDNDFRMATNTIQDAVEKGQKMRLPGQVQF